MAGCLVYERCDQGDRDHAHSNGRNRSDERWPDLHRPLSARERRLRYALCSIDDVELRLRLEILNADRERARATVPGGCVFQFNPRHMDPGVRWTGCREFSLRTFLGLIHKRGPSAFLFFLDPQSEMATSTLPRPTLPTPQHYIDLLLPQQQQQQPQHTSLNAILKRPIPNSYWATPLLLACEYPWCPGVAKQKIEALLAAGVRTFIDLTEVNELRAYESYLSTRTEAMGLTDVEYHRFPIVDRSLPKSIEYVRNILAVLKDNEQRGRITAVHCRGGIGRTGKPALLS